MSLSNKNVAVFKLQLSTRNRKLLTSAYVCLLDRKHIAVIHNMKEKMYYKNTSKIFGCEAVIFDLEHETVVYQFLYEDHIDEKLRPIGPGETVPQIVQLAEEMKKEIKTNKPNGKRRKENDQFWRENFKLGCGADFAIGKFDTAKWANKASDYFRTSRKKTNGK